MSTLSDLDIAQLRSVAVDLGFAFTTATDRDTMIDILQRSAEDPMVRIRLQEAIDRICRFDNCRGPVMRSIDNSDDDNQELPVFRTFSMMHT